MRNAHKKGSIARMEEEQSKVFFDIEVSGVYRAGEMAVVAAHSFPGRGHSTPIIYADPLMTFDSLAQYNAERAEGLIPSMVHFPEELAGDLRKKKTKPKKKRATPSPLLKSLLKGIKK